MNGKHYINEPLSASFPILPAIYFKSYKPYLSVAVENGEAVFYKHYSLNENGNHIFSIYLIIKNALMFFVLFIIFMIMFILLLIISKLKIAHIMWKRRYV